MKNNKGNVPKPGKPQYVPHIIIILPESPQTADGKADTRNPLPCLLVMIQIIPIQPPCIATDCRPDLRTAPLIWGSCSDRPGLSQINKLFPSKRAVLPSFRSIHRLYLPELLLLHRTECISMCRSFPLLFYPRRTPHRTSKRG